MDWTQKAEDIFKESHDGYEVKEGSRGSDRITLLVGSLLTDELKELSNLATVHDLSIILSGAEDYDVEIELKEKRKK